MRLAYDTPAPASLVTRAAARRSRARGSRCVDRRADGGGRLPWRAVLAVLAGFPAACREPDSTPEDLAKAAESARAEADKVREAIQKSAAVAETAPAEAPKEELKLHPLTEGSPDCACSPVEVEFCAFDTVGGAVVKGVGSVKREGNVKLRGWAARPGTEEVPPVVIVVLAGDGNKSYHAPAQRISPRPDVASHFDVPALVGSGFDLLTSFKDVAAGEYEVRIVQVDRDGNALSCDTKKKLEVGAGAVSSGE